MLKDLPAEVIALIGSASTCEYTTISAAGIPIDTPVLYFPSDDLRSIDLATGLSYPAKAERARKNPKVGLLIEGGADEPVVAIGGMAAVRDADLQSNVLRYLSEAGQTLPGNPDWAVARKAVWYWTRIIVETMPARILWWDRPDRMDEPPHRWDAPAGTVYPLSDPAPPGAISKSSKWEQPPWQTLAEKALARGGPGHLSTIHADGFPLPLRARSIQLVDQGFILDMPRGIAWQTGAKASFTFAGIETFLGEITADGGAVTLTVERTLPVFPMTQDQSELWHPKPNTYDNLMRRLTHETERRGLPIPTIPEERPKPTAGYHRRLARFRALAADA